MPFFLSKTTKDMHQPIVPKLFSLLELHVSEAEFMRPDPKWEENVRHDGQSDGR